MTEIPITEIYSDTISNFQIIYLDQKGWINLTRPENIEVKELLKTKVNASKAVFPISLAHVMETKKMGSSRRRNILISLMIELSGGYTISPLNDYRIELEFQNYIFSVLKLNQRDNKKYIIRKGLANIAGGIPTISSKEKLDEKMSQELVQMTRVFLGDINNLKNFVMNYPFTPDQIIDDWNTTIRFELHRTQYLAIQNNEKRKNQFMRENFKESLEPKIISYCNKNGLDHTFFTKNQTSSNISQLIDKIPTIYCTFNLLYYRDQLRERPIQENDTYDIWALSHALPYCDIVQADNLFANIAIQQKLGEKCNSTIIKKIEELPGLLS